MADDVLEAYRRGLDVREYRRMLDAGTLPVDERADLREAARRNIPVDQLRRERAARVGTGVTAPDVRRSASASNLQMADVPGNIPPSPSASSIRAARENLSRYADMQDVDMPGNIPPVSRADIRRAQQETMRIADMQAADVPGNISASAPVGLTPPDEVQQALSRARVNRERQRNRPTTRMTPAVSEADALNQRELDRIAAARGVLSGGDIQPRELNLDERIGASMDRTLGRIGLRRTNETGEGAPSTGSFREDLRGLGRALGLKKGGKVKKMAKGGAVKAPSASRRGDGIAARGKTKGRMV